ncbi:MAG: ribose 5-phosphate isomerase B [Flavobacteriaceae bacterium]|nr:ribose 5-phosphate isomerase B [Flavobacteriaceae bacterium]MCY4267606.1 ribose 5-phosphate isomerase B [Flavobacteriaceae bacterium]
MITQQKVKIFIGCDHAGYELKECLMQQLSNQQKFDIKDFGTYSKQSVDYPDFIHQVAQAVQKDKESKGLIICGSGNGAAMTANKYAGIRAAICWNKSIAELARTHNDANILSLPARFIGPNEAHSMLKIFIETEFEGGRHQRRVNKIDCS